MVFSGCFREGCGIGEKGKETGRNGESDKEEATGKAQPSWESITGRTKNSVSHRKQQSPRKPSARPNSGTGRKCPLEEGGREGHAGLVITASRHHPFFRREKRGAGKRVSQLDGTVAAGGESAVREQTGLRCTGKTVGLRFYILHTFIYIFILVFMFYPFHLYFKFFEII